MRDSCIFYRSFYEALKDLPPEIRAQLYDAIFEYSLNMVESELSGIAATVFKLIKPQLDANIKRFKNGSEPKNKQNGSKTEANDKQDISETEANNNNNNNQNKNENINNNPNENFKPIIGSFNNDKTLEHQILLNYFKDRYTEKRNLRYQITQKDVLSIPMLIEYLEAVNTGQNSVEMTKQYIDLTLSITQSDNKWIFDNLSISLLANKFNEINNLIQNKHGINRGFIEQSSIDDKIAEIDRHLASKKSELSNGSTRSGW